jgi:CubicO group peptidase (beta-lactamase class C family)
MRISLLMRAAAASAAVTLFLSPGLEAALAHAQASFRPPVTRPVFGASHRQAQGWGNGGRQWWSQNGRNRWSRNGRDWNWGGLYGSGFWYSPYGSADASSGASSVVPVIVVGAPSFNGFPAAVAEGADPNAEGGCVIHKLIYDGSGKYLGERQIPGC